MIFDVNQIVSFLHQKSSITTICFSMCSITCHPFTVITKVIFHFCFCSNDVYTRAFLPRPWIYIFSITYDIQMFYYIICRTSLKPIGSRAYSRLLKYKQQHTTGLTENSYWVSHLLRTAMIIFTYLCTEQTF